MVAERVILVDEESDIGRFLEQAEEEPFVADIGGRRFRVILDTTERSNSYDPERARRSFQKIVGIFEGADTAALREELLAQREQDSIGRPADR